MCHYILCFYCNCVYIGIYWKGSASAETTAVLLGGVYGKFSNFTQRNWVFDTNSNVLIPISL